MARGKWQIEHLVMRPFNWRWFEVSVWLARFDWLKQRIPWWREDGLNVFFLAVNEDIHVDEGTPLPVEVIYELIDRASDRVIVDKCLCRAALGCETYPHEIGCLMMGRSALEITPDYSRRVCPEEAKEHVRRAADAGLLPFFGKALVDNLVFGIKNKKELLSVCFCCECCSISRFARHVPPEKRVENFNILGGIRIEVGEKCNGCGNCVDYCFVKAIQVEGERAVIGEGCVACGRCAKMCHRHAISISLSNPDVVNEVCDHIAEYVHYR